MALIYSSDPEKRKTLAFISCVIAVAFGTVPSILFLNILIKNFTAIGTDNVNLAEEMKPYILSLSFFSPWSSICVDLILLIRLIPLLRLPGAPNKTALLGPLFLLKLGRVAAVSVFTFNLTKKSKTLLSDDPTQFYTVASHMLESKVVWCLQLADNALCSFFFLFLMQRTISKTLRNTSGYVQRLRVLFLIAVSNFVFPVIFVAIELILVTRNLGYFALGAINISRTNIEIIGILFATIWASTRSNGGVTGSTDSKIDADSSAVIASDNTHSLPIELSGLNMSKRDGSVAAASEILSTPEV
ncbi:hypothetical protein K435DRAFT_864609 [Dendrothele bispora CBS 962.96]|uniref:G-protein coupled receptors family 1 profile domain-containing protein n=1 Tax=Dendrothele bispora (strain CBS 962.96) TaxID=1314807 RepID=A0A4S8LLQ5_DENBC|nr:hypothetical protein K435DRAFT_864609 [Dendrothele bispora CBS 962.96]